MTGRRLVVAALAVALAQIGFLAWIIAGRAAILRDGREVLLKVEPVDPRDLLRGDYVRLGYEVSSVPLALVSNLPAGAENLAESAIVVRLQRQADGYWRAVSARLGSGGGQPAGAGDIDIRGTSAATWSLAPDDTLRVSYGIERFYLPEGEGRAIEQDMRLRSFGIVAAVDAHGTAQIKRLMDGDRLLFEEPLY
ncbi:MAG: GDYXXLXY domain-containing protein [Rhizobiaceae bacterium]|nr:GDYXXLXY domain-containing protein [Rhizobiaceae bacterium]